jgi:predicted lipoprotein
MADNEFDFGFTFEDNDFSTSQTAQQNVQQPVDAEFKDELLEKMTALEEKLEMLTTGDTTDLIEQHKQLLTSEVRGKLQQVEGMILPLLYNLQKNPDKEYIHWPNRKDIIQKQIDKILKVTRHYG